MRVDFYRNARSDAPVVTWLDELSKEDKGSIIGCLKSVEKLGFESPRVTFKHVEDNLWEIKIGKYRIFYTAVTKERIVLLHGYRKQTQKAPIRELSTARTRLKELA